MLLKWHLYRIWYKELSPPHFKYCICICPVREWFLFVNTNPPFGRKARALAIHVANYQLQPLTHDSYIDSAYVEECPQDGRLQAALNDPQCCYGLILPTLQNTIKSVVKTHNALTDDQRDAILK